MKVKWEAQIAKSTVPKGTILNGDLIMDKWYPVTQMQGGKGKNAPYFWIGNGTIDHWIYTGKLDSAHLDGGNWKLRKVK
jgi:hypothetical protein